MFHSKKGFFFSLAILFASALVVWFVIDRPRRTAKPHAMHGLPLSAVSLFPARTLSFPTDTSVGRVYFAEAAPLGDARWGDSVPARGKVRIPPGKMAWLTVAAELGDLSFLIALDPQALQALDMREARPDDDGLLSFIHLRSLRALYLQNSMVTDRGLEHIARLRSLEALYLTGTRATEPGLAHLSGLTALRELSLPFKIGDEGLGHLRAMKSVRIDPHRRHRPASVIDSRRVGDSGLRTIKQLTYVRDLSLRRSRVTDSGLVHLEAMTWLRRLDLSRTAIGDAGLVHLGKLDGLRSLDLRATRVTLQGLDSLRFALPDCRILHSLPARAPGAIPAENPVS